MRAEIIAFVLSLGVGYAGFAWAAEHAVDNKAKAFQPKMLEAKVGDTVTFTNSDPFTHNMFSKTPGHEFDLQTLEPGQKKTLTFAKAGAVEVRCAIHPLMKMTVNVTE